MGKAKPATVENAPVVAPKIEKPAEAKTPALSRQEVIDRWQGMSADERLQATLDSGMFTTKKGELSAIGKRFAAQESMEKAGDSRINGLAAAMGREESVRAYAANSGLISHSNKDKPLSEKQKETYGKSYEQALKRESSGASFSQEDIGKLKLQKDTAVSLKNATGIGGKKLISIQNVHDKAGERIQIEQTENGLAIHFGGGLGRKYNTAGKTLQDVVDYVAGALRKRVEAKPKAQAAEKKSGGEEVSQQAKPNAFSDSRDSREVLGDSDVANAYSAITPVQMDGKTTLKTNAGRTTAPIPKKGSGSPRAYAEFTHRLAKWLMTEAYQEAQHNQDSYHSMIFKQSLESMKGKGDKRPTGYEDAPARGYVFGDNTVPVRRDPFFEADASDDLKFSRSDNDHNSKSAYEAAKAARKTELTFHQWQQVRTPEFKQWFGDWENDPDNASKVVNPRTGEPLAMYHGTSHSQEGNAFTRFDTYGSNYGLMGQGSYFTDNAGVASSYTEKGRGDSPSVYSVFLNIRNPIDMDAQADAQAWADAYPDAADYHDGGSTNESWFRAMEEALQADGVYAAEGAEQVAAAVAEMGYDGVSHIGGGRVASDGVKHRVYIAHEPNQIKSATGNSGAFDAKNDDIRYSRSEDAKRTSPEQIKQTRQAVAEVLSEAHMRHIDVTTAAQAAKARPEYARELVNAEGFFDPKTKKITLIADNLPNADVARFVAWHELGHRGVDVAGFNAWKSKFKSFYNLNPTFKALTDSIQNQRSGYNSKAPSNTDIFMEEAAVELYAAHKTGNYARLQEKYGVVVPKAARADIGGYLRRLANNLKRILAKAFGLNQNHFSDADIYDLLNGIDAATGETLSSSLNEEMRFSRSGNTQAAYEQRIDELFAGAKAEGKNGVRVLDRSDMLDMLGYGNMPLTLNELKLVEGADNHPLMTADVWKKIPEWIENPAMVFNSDTVKERLVFIAPEQVNGNDVRIIVEPNGDALGAHLLFNAYDTKAGAAPYLRWANDKLMHYADTKKAPQINERLGLQLPKILKNPALKADAQIHGMGHDNSKALGLGKILTENNLQGYRKRNPFEQDGVKFSMKDTPEVMAANTSKAIKAVSASSITKALSGGRKAADLLKVGLQFLGRRQIVDIYGRLLPNLKTYSDIVQQMDAEKHDVSASADKLADTWGKLKDGDALAALMHEATLAQIDADADVGAQTGDDEVDNILLLGSKANIAFFPKSCIVVYV